MKCIGSLIWLLIWKEHHDSLLKEKRENGDFLSEYRIWKQREKDSDRKYLLAKVCSIRVNHRKHKVSHSLEEGVLTHHSVTMHLGSIWSKLLSAHSDMIPKQGLELTKSTWEHIFLAARFEKSLVRVLYPLPHVTEHSDHSDQGVVAQDTSPTQSTTQESFWIRVTAQPVFLAFPPEM